jgi:glycerol-3-phosphate acyltransferase PlsY
MEFGLLVLGAYLMGSVPAAYLAAKLSRGIDIRQYGDGNVGATNLLRLTSKWVAIPVIIFDLGKGLIMVLAAQLVGLGIAQQVTVGLAAIIGHNWPIFLHFNGGRGILTTLGVITIMVPWIGLIVFLIAYGLAPFHQLAFGVLLSVIAAPTSAWFLSQPLGVADKLPITLGFLVMFLIVTFRRLTAPRTSFTASVPLRQLLVNRLLFDRDIRDREVWIHHASREASKTNNRESQGKVDSVK